MHHSGCGDARILMKEMRGHLCVQVELSAKEVSVSVLRGLVDLSVIDPSALWIVEKQKDEEFVIQ